VRFEFESEIVSFVLPLPLFRSKIHVCLSHGVQVAGAAWHATMSIMVGVGDLVQRTGDGRVRSFEECPIWWSRIFGVFAVPSHASLCVV
jgi:hypothetical protein